MRRYLRAAQILALLIGFYLVCVVLVVGLAALTVWAFATIGGNRLSILLLLVTLSGIFVVIRGVFVSTHLRARDVGGIEVSPTEQPALWGRIRQLAAQVGTRAPRRLYLVPDVNAAVWENTRLLGLVPGRRQMMVGLPLLMGLTLGQLDAVLAHELGHYSNRDTRMGGLVSRTRQSVMSALRAAGRRGKVTLPGANLFVLVFQTYAKLVLRVTQPASRAQEYAADRVAAEIAGPANMIAALSQLSGLDAAFDFYLSRYVGPGLELGLLPPPPQLFGGFAGMLAEPARRAELDEMLQNPTPERQDPYDSHPPMADRIAALGRLPRGTPGPGPDPTGVAAMDLLANPADALARVALRALDKQVAGKQAVTWDTLASSIGLHRADQQAEPLLEVVARLSGRPADLGVFVEMVYRGRLFEILDALPVGEASRRTNATGRVALEHAKTQLASALTGWLVGYLARRGRVGWAHSWADAGGELRMAPELKARLTAAVDALVAVRPDPSQLHGFVQETMAVTV